MEVLAASAISERGLRRRDVAADAETGARGIAQAARFCGEVQDCPTESGAIERQRSARVSEPAWNSERSRSVFTSSGGGSIIRSKP